jgi:predicted TIM-barrel fold metal-dependent hydrolase
MATHGNAGGKANHIDVHHHFYPPEFRQAVTDFSGGFQLPAVNAWRPEASLDQMDQNGVSTAILSLWSIPGVWMGSDAAGMRRWARLVNEYATRMRADHPNRFGLFAALPLPDVEGSLAEIAYAFDVLKADGVGLMTNFGNKWPGDPAYAPVFEELNRRKAVVYFHPVAPACCAGNLLPGIQESWAEVPYDTGRCVLSLLFSGTFARLRDITWIFSHSGGTVPIIAQRTATLAQHSPRVKEVAPAGIDHELTRLYYETANGFHAPNMAALLAYVPITQVMFGTDYPYVTVRENAEGLARVVKGAKLKAIQSGNALRLFPRLAAKPKAKAA